MDAVSDMHNEPYPEVKMSANTSIPDMQYSRFSVYWLASISTLIPERRRGIYVLEFSNGEFYVGKAQNVVRRFAQHKHGRTNHDEAWKDIEKLWFMPVSKNKDFTQIESDEICRFRASGKR